MAKLRVFVSSTCFDLGIVRNQLRSFLQNMAYEPIMSEYSDILYDPRIHTHVSCVDEVKNADVMILIIGSRFGGQAIPEAVSSISLDQIKLSSKAAGFVEDPSQKFSITQIESMMAIESGLPVYVFIEDKVLHDHEVYEKNKSSEHADKIIFPSVQKQETAKYIFEYINFLRFRNVGNSIYSFSRVDDIEDILKKQWSFLFQKLLEEQKSKVQEDSRIDYLSEQLRDLRSAVLAAIPDDEAKEIARGVIRYRFLLSFCNSIIGGKTLKFASEGKLFGELLSSADIENIKEIKPELPGDRPFVAFTLKTGGFLFLRRPIFSVKRYSEEWDSFCLIKASSRKVIFEAILENTMSTIELRKIDGIPEEYNKNQRERNSLLDWLVDREDESEREKASEKYKSIIKFISKNE